MHGPPARGDISLPKNGLYPTLRRVCSIAPAAFFLAFLPAARPAPAQQVTPNRYYSRGNSYGIFAAYSGDSSHILLGDSEKRKLLEFGGSYNRRLRIGRIVNWQYSAEFLPVALEGDPLSIYVNDQVQPTASTVVTPESPTVFCSPVAEGYSFPGADGETYSGTISLFCKGRRWSMGEAISPIGMQWNFRPTRKLQPFLDCHGGYMFSTKEIPVESAGSFNFTFDFGAGLELYRTRTRSVRVEYRIHHISNDNTAARNPGIDNGLFQLTYSFGLGRRERK
jgi:opacity protein-like surface antigen